MTTPHLTLNTVPIRYFKFCDVDGQGAASVVPIPTAVISSILSDPEVVKKYDAMTVADRVAEVREQKILTEDQLAFLLPFFAVASGTSVEKASLLEALKWFVVSRPRPLQQYLYWLS